MDTFIRLSTFCCTRFFYQPLRTASLLFKTSYFYTNVMNGCAGLSFTCTFCAVSRVSPRETAVHTRTSLWPPPSLGGYILPALGLSGVRQTACTPGQIMRIPRDTCMNPGTTPSIILLSDCRKPEVFDIWNKLMLGSHIGDISIHTTFILFWASILSTLRRGLARSPPAERDHTWSTRLFASVYSQNSLVRIVRTVRTSQSVLFSDF